MNASNTASVKKELLNAEDTGAKEHGFHSAERSVPDPKGSSRTIFVHETYGVSLWEARDWDLGQMASWEADYQGLQNRSDGSQIYVDFKKKEQI